MKKLIFIFVICCLTSSNAISNDAITTSFDSQLVVTDNQGRDFQYPGAKNYQIGPEITLPGLTFLVEMKNDESALMISSNSTSENSILIDFQTDDITTSSDNQYPGIEKLTPDNQKPGRSAVYIADNLKIADINYAQLILFPVVLSQNSELTMIKDISININDRLLTQADLLEPDVIIEASKNSQSLSPLSGVTDYLVVTSQLFAKEYQKFVDYKNSIGISTKLVLIEDILANFNGRDDAEKLRERLKQFYADGGQYVLLGGDETVVPIRYAYHYRTSTDVELAYLQVSDLYFADVDGDWNADGDNVWGERYDDDADLTNELLVGRLPMSDTLEIQNYINKLIAYETNPGGGDFDWLTRSYFYSSDQMRDYRDTGQHMMIAESYPDWFTNNTVTAVENASGIDVAPNNVPPLETIHELSKGYGIVNIIAHGRSDGFVVKSSEYNAWPKSYLLTAPQNGEHSSTDSISPNGLTGFYYSLACDNGGFDLERINPSSPCLTRGLLGIKKAGAVGFIANSRWGWVGSSYLMQKSFFDTLFANPDRPAIEAFYAVKAQYYYLRDIVLGQNYYGDPTMKVYTDIPSVADIKLVKSGNSYKAIVTTENTILSNTTVFLSKNGSVISEYITDSNGEILLSNLSEPDEEYQIAVIKEGFTVGYFNFAPSIVTEVDDDNDALPETFSLGQNYPNPFNPTTIIPFEMSHPGRVNLSVFNVLGQKVTTLADEIYAVGKHEIRWDGKNASGNPVSSGLYFYVIESGTNRDVKKMLLLE